MPSVNKSSLEIPMPTYLQDIFRSREVINLVHKRVHPSHLADISELQKDMETSNIDVDLVGNPLVVDLGEPVDFDALEEGKQPNNWTRDEAQYGPIDLSEAKQYLNTVKKVNTTQVCLLDSKDSRKTLALFLGSDEALFSRGFVKYFGHYSMKENEASFDTLLKHHYQFCEKDADVQCAVNTLYPIVGVNKRHADDVAHKNIGESAFIEVFSSDRQFFSTNNMCKLFLQVNAAAQKSVFHPLWQQLTLVQKFIDYLEDEDDLKSVVISADPKPFQAVAEEITTLLRSFDTKQYDQHIHINWAEINVENMRNYDFLDRLWTALLHLEDLEQVLESFHALFNDLADEPMNDIPGLNQGTLAVIINGLINGNMAVPTLTLTSSLRILIELGLNKLHNDYLFLIQSMDSKGEAYFIEQWITISEANTQITTANARKSRMTIAKGNQNIGQLIKQLNHIANMHVITAFMHLAKNCKLVGTDTERQIFDRLYKSKDVAKTFKTLQRSAIVDFDCELFSDQFSLMNKLTAVAINIKFYTKCRGESTLTTIFHFSMNPIFPPCIFKTHEVEEGKTEEKNYYVHMANIFVN